jgi:hypothetical protein
VTRGLLLAAMVALTTPAAAQHDPTAGTHGMVIFGARGELLSHLPLYRAPHDWQMLLRVSLAADGATSVPDPVATLAADRAATGEVLYTLEPEPFAHSELASGERREFRGTLYRGHFERGGVPIARGVVVRTEAVLHRCPLLAGQPHASAGQHLLIASGGEGFLVHRIDGAPDFDQILEVRADAALPEGASEVTSALTGARGVGERIELHGGGAPVVVEVVRQIYLERGDLEAPE